MNDFLKFINLLKKSWSAETSYSPGEWTSINPARGQCVISSLILQDCFGGNIVLHPSPPHLGKFKSVRERLMSDPDTVKRYEILKSRLGV